MGLCLKHRREDCQDCTPAQIGDTQKLPPPPDETPLPATLTPAAMTSVVDKRDHASHKQLRAGVTGVHIRGHPFLWLLRLIIDRCPDLQTIQIIPSKLQDLSERHHRIARRANVEIRGGHVGEEWDNRSAGHSEDYLSKRRRFLEIDGAEAARWEELKRFGFECAEMTQRYFALDGYEYQSGREIGQEFGITQNAYSKVSKRVRGVLVYVLDLKDEYGTGAQSFASTIQRRVEYIRRVYIASGSLSGFAMRIGLTSLPEGVRPRDFPMIELICAARVQGVLSQLYRQNARAYGILVERYGIRIGQHPPQPVQTLEVIGQRHGITKERVRQIEWTGLQFLMEHLQKGLTQTARVDQELLDLVSEFSLTDQQRVRQVQNVGAEQEDWPLIHAIIAQALKLMKRSTLKSLMHDTRASALPHKRIMVWMLHKHTPIKHSQLGPHLGIPLRTSATYRKAAEVYETEESAHGRLFRSLNTRCETLARRHQRRLERARRQERT